MCENAQPVNARTFVDRLESSFEYVHVITRAA
jgi:hypothetical protein